MHKKNVPASGKSLVTLTFKAVIDHSVYDVGDGQVEDFLKEEAAELKSSAPPGATIDYTVTAEPVTE